MTPRPKQGGASRRRPRGRTSAGGTLSAPRRARILDAALAEFAEHGFEAGSTNAIASAAGIAKGLVFHHFGNKEGLFLAVFDRVIARVTDAVYAGMGALPADLFQRLHSFAVHKLRVFQRDPLGYQLVTIATHDSPPALRARIGERIAALRTQAWSRVIAGIDVSPLRPGVTLLDAVETVAMLGEGIERSVLPRLASLPDRGASQIEALSREVWAHFERLRNGLYR